MKAILFSLLVLITSSCAAQTINVKNITALRQANKNAKPGDIIVLQNGEWKDVSINLDCSGTKEKPITFRAQNAGEVIITGNSKLMIGGNYIIVDGLYFKNGFSGEDPIITFRTNKNKIANNCRLTNTVINDFNNPVRLDQNYWIALYGKHNRVDHCSFFNKKNMGVLLAVILDDERSRENFHSIDHNHFGFRMPLASNTGETIRVGVSQHCEFNSNTMITDNFFENCDGETEIVSIKSGRNIIRNNLFKESQGSVVMRHGNYNLVENNVFLGNNKRGTGGVRVINKGQWVVNNLFYKCRGTGFRSPLAIMNGVPNSPAFRYVAVTDAVIANNSFIDCSPLSLAEGSDTERTVPPQDVAFLNNVFYNNMDTVFYRAHDDISKMTFSGNIINRNLDQTLQPGFLNKPIITQQSSGIILPVINNYLNKFLMDSLNSLGDLRLTGNFSARPGFSDKALLEKIILNADTDCGAKWFEGAELISQKEQIEIDCVNASDLQGALKKNENKNLVIYLTGKVYEFDQPIKISSDVVLTSKDSSKIKFITRGAGTGAFIYLQAGNKLEIKNLSLDLNEINNKIFITTDTSGSSNHSNFLMSGCKINGLKGSLFHAAKTSLSDSVVITGNFFSNTSGTLFVFNNEDDKKGYYNVEKLRMSFNDFLNHYGQIISMLRGGNDESTMGPLVVFADNILKNCNADKKALIHFIGTQKSYIRDNLFYNCNPGGVLIQYEDEVKASHQFTDNQIENSGKNKLNNYVHSAGNIMR